MMNSRDIDDSTVCFLTEDQEVGIVVHEDEGEVLRLESDENITFDQLDLLYFIYTHEPTPKTQIIEEYDADGEKVESVIDDLHHRGEVYQPTKGLYKIVENAVEN
jgi:hypothetical protein